MSSLILDYTHALADAIGATHGLNDAEIDTLVAKFPKHHENIEELRAAGESAFFDLPYQDTTEIKALIKKHTGKWDAVVVVGIGGAAHTPMSLVRSLGHSRWNELPAKARKNAPKLFSLENLDPQSLTDLTEVIDPKKTLFVIVSKSGNTAESNALILWLTAWLKKKANKTALANQIVICTDTERSPLAEVAKLEKMGTLHIPANLQDRFAVLGPQSLFIAGLCGFDIDAILAGGAAMDKRCRQDDALQNPAYMHSLIHYLLTRKRRKTIHAMMAFSDRLYEVVDWYSHLLSVSLGKMNNRKGKAVHVGPGPAQCVGASGCYGQMQLFQEGPFDKVTTFITTKDHGCELAVPKAYPKIEAMAYLDGKSFDDLIAAGYTSAAQIITATGRPNMTIVLDDISEGSVAGLFYMLQLSAVMSAELYGIDAFNQPGVDANKQSVFALMGRAGFENKATILEAYKATERKTC